MKFVCIRNPAWYNTYGMLVLRRTTVVKEDDKKIKQATKTC